MTDYAARTTAGVRELVDVERRGVRGEDALGRGHPSEVGERPLLEVHVLEHRFDDDINLIEPVVGRHRGDELHRPLEGFLCHPTFRHR